MAPARRARGWGRRAQSARRWPSPRTSSGASAGRPRPPARHFQFCLPLRPGPRRAPGTAGSSRAPPAPPPWALTALRPSRVLSRSRFVCSLTGDRAPPGCGVSPAARGVWEASPTLDALSGGEDAAGSPRGRPGQCEPCPSPGAQRVGEVARTFGQGRGTCGTSGPVRRRADTRMRLPTAAPRGSVETRGPLCPAVIWRSVSPQLAEEPWSPTPFAGGPSNIKDLLTFPSSSSKRPSHLTPRRCYLNSGYRGKLMKSKVKEEERR
ncbi:translation initiation factor IF-2-like [Cervus canadensis]|uniref:translation initiation factor IF-2-like n=1 Tax=Cervus canadensis TaxID=1574408 RepID=UPI001C9E2207|nr:translation initiation factor IF-2-like [Cervus canadensis]